jgi:hypothetical protein
MLIHCGLPRLFSGLNNTSMGLLWIFEGWPFGLKRGEIWSRLEYTCLKVLKNHPRSLFIDIEAWTFFYNLTGSEVSAVESQYLRCRTWQHSTRNAWFANLQICSETFVLFAIWSTFLSKHSFRHEIKDVLANFHAPYIFLLCRRQFCLLWLHRAVDFKASCSQIPRLAFAGIPTHNPSVQSPTS